MNRSDLIVEITALAEEAERSDEHDTAIVLFMLVLAIGESHDADFARYVARYTPPGSQVLRVPSA